MYCFEKEDLPFMTRVALDVLAALLTVIGSTSSLGCSYLTFNTRTLGWPWFDELPSSCLTRAPVLDKSVSETRSSSDSGGVSSKLVFNTLPMSSSSWATDPKAATFRPVELGPSPSPSPTSTPTPTPSYRTSRRTLVPAENERVGRSG